MITFLFSLPLYLIDYQLISSCLSFLCLSVNVAAVVVAIISSHLCIRSVLNHNDNDAHMPLCRHSNLPLILFTCLLLCWQELYSFRHCCWQSLDL